jgi:hypothetical protein
MSQERDSANEPETRSRPPFLVGLFRVLMLLAVLVLLFHAFTAPIERRDQPGWTEYAEMPAPRGEMSAATGMRNEGCANPPCEVVAVLGGFEPPFFTSRLAEAYIPDEGRWIPLPDLPGARHHPAAAGLPDGSIVLTGGSDSLRTWEPKSEAWMLAPDSDEWAPMDRLPEARYGHRLVAVDERLYSIGGHDATSTFVWTVADGWTEVAPIPEPRDHLSAVLVDGEIWALGGRHNDENTGRVDIYDPDSDSWRDGPPLPEPTSGATVGLIDRTLVIVAGEDPSLIGGGMIRDSWMIDVDDVDERWFPLVQPPIDLHGTGEAVIGEGDDARLLILGGSGRNGLLSPLAWSDRVLVLEDPQVRDD